MALQYNFLSCFIFIYVGLWTSEAGAVNCPKNCKCSWILDSLEVDCSNRGLVEYPNFNDMPIEHLDLSGNNFVEFPKELADMESLIYLDLSNNKIEYIDSDALLGFMMLRTLLLANNSITSWANINPNDAFLHAISLKRLSLSGNHLGSFTMDNHNMILISESLTQLELEYSNITVASGDLLMNGLPNLERLLLSNNKLSNIVALPSKSLRVLELSNCNLQSISSFLLQGLPSLEALNLSWNAALQFGSRADSIISSSLNELDISFCNVDDINLSGLPSLTQVRLRGNMLRSINTATFNNNTQLESIDLARNSLRIIEGESFAKLKRLTKLDLSYNEIARLDRNLFRSNDALVTLNLSRNVIDKFTKFSSNSLRDINLSWCEIISIDIMAFSGLTAIQRLDLSNNLVNDFPGSMRSETLQILNLSNCRLTALRNDSFRNFPELAKLRLNGNRFTNPLPTDIFRSNKFLDEIWLGDNPWICNCYDTIFMDFFDYLTAKPQKLKDRNNARCASPTVYYGRTWEGACGAIWAPNGHTSSADRVWTTLLIIIVIISVLAITSTAFKKYMKNRKRSADTGEYRRNQEEMAAIRQQNQRMLQQDGTPNAPDAFESNLPSYEDAILMPKLERPVKSMVDLTASERMRNKLRRSETDPAAEDDGILLDNRQNFRSEEMLSNRDKERMAQIGPYRRTGRIEHNNSGSRRFSIEDSRFPAAYYKSQNLQSAEHIGNFQSYENSPYTKRKAKIAEIPPFKRATMRTDSVEFLTDPEFDANSKPGSPFARRKPKSPLNTPTIQDSNKALEPAIENYFSSVKKSPYISSDGSDFQVVIEPDVASLSDGDSSSTAGSAGMAAEVGKRKKRKNSSSRRVSGNFSAAAAAAAAEDTSSSSDREPIVVVHKPMRETLF